MAWPLIAPPGTPRERVELLRASLETMLRDQAIIAEGEREGMDIGVIPGRDLESVIQRLYTTPPEVVALVRKFSESR